MAKKIFIISSLLILTAVFAGVVYAQFENVSYPVKELGGCTDQAACKKYCDDSANANACLAFAKANQLMSDEEIAVAQKFLSGKLNGPGGCKDKDSCEVYCEDISHMDECIAFAEKNNFLPEDKLAEAKKVQAAIAKGVTPPACGNKKACDVYCEDSAHMEECINFAVEAGFMQGKELEDAQKMLQAVKRGVKPPPCKGKEACDEYCSNPDNMETCMNFAMEAGMMSEQERADSQKMLEALKKGVKPPPCKGKEACDEYCGSEEHFEECTNFAVAAGFMSEKDAAMAKKTGGKGPGGCKGKEECEAFCKNPDNQETCFNFAKDNGMISDEDLKRMEEGKQRTAEVFSSASEETIQCLNNALGADKVEEIKNGTAMMSQEIGDKMQTCFMQGGGMQGPQGPQMAPCKSPEECKVLCESNPDKCENGMPKFQPGPGQMNPGGQMMPQQAGPGGCKTPEECQSYCQSNLEECKNFYPAGDNSGAGPGPMTPQQGQMMPQQAGPGGCQSPQECDAYCQINPQACGAPSGSSGGQMPPPCQGENCQYSPMPGQPMQPIQPGQELLPGQNIQQPSGGPGGGGTMVPEMQNVPLAPSTNQMPPAGQMPPEGQQMQPPSGNLPPTSLKIDADYLVSSFIYIFLKAFIIH